MTHDELKAIKARAEAATPGPWTRSDGDGISPGRRVWQGDRQRRVANCDAFAIQEGDWGKAQDATNAEFIAHARTDVPNLVAEVERLRKLLLARGAQECSQCGTILDVSNRHISGLMCIPCSLPVMDDTMT